MEQARTIGELRTRIREILDPLVARTCCLVDVPNHANSGDYFIWAGERKYFADRGYAPSYEVASRFIDGSKIPPGSQILFHGGGSFGDIYGRHHSYREEVIAKFKDHPILVLPQTVWFKDKARLLRSAELFSRHPDVTVCARDMRSFRILQEYFPKNKSVLVPDMVFCMEPPARDPSASCDGRILFLSRSDGESGPLALRTLIPPSAEIRDWPLYERLSVRLRYALAFALNRALLAVSGSLGVIPHERFDATTLFVSQSVETHILGAVSLLRPYDLVITERLHGHILACMMGIPSILFDNSYGKTAAFHATWMTKIPGSYFARGREEFEHILRTVGV